MIVKFDYSNLMNNSMINVGLDNSMLENYTKNIEKAHNDILVDRKNNILGFYDLPDKDISKINNFAKKARKKFDNFVVLGIGGSALGNKALYSALKIEKSLDKKLFVIDNVDPYLLYEVLSEIDIKKTIFNVITKSGTTAETMSTYLIILDILKKEIPDNYKDHIVVTTDAKEGFLRELVDKENYQSFIVPNNVGGRFSVLTDVGLLSSAFCGIDTDKLLKGAAKIRKRCEEKDITKNPAYLNGLLHFLHMKSGRNISVMMPYSNSLYDLADWYRQLWAESLGKKLDINSNEVFVGQTPVKALGTTDQHSQVQLYTEGPDDKVITLLSVERYKHDYVIPDVYSHRDEVNYLAHKKLSKLLNTECRATEISLTKANRANCHIVFPKIDEETIGQFIFMYEVQTIFTGKLLNINPLDQPGVEAGKIATYVMMGKNGFEKQIEAINNYNDIKKEEGGIL